MTHPCGPDNDEAAVDALLDWLDDQDAALSWDVPADPPPLAAFTEAVNRQVISDREAIERAAWDDTKAEERRAEEQAWRDRLTGDVMP